MEDNIDLKAGFILGLVVCTIVLAAVMPIYADVVSRRQASVVSACYQLERAIWSQEDLKCFVD